MTNHLRRFAFPALAWALISGCTESSLPEATGKGNIRGMNAIVTAPNATFLIEARSLGTLGYKQVSAMQEFDDLTYSFHFDALLPGESSPSRIASENLSVVPDTDYLFILTGTTTSPNVLLWESELRRWDGEESVLEVAAGHLADSLGDIDVYLLPDGGAPEAGTSLGSLSFGERLPAADMDAGDYRLFVTPQGDPATVLFRSALRSYPERTSFLITVQEADPSITSDLSVRRIDAAGSSVELPQAGRPPQRRFFHAVPGADDVDIYIGEDSTTPVVSNLAYGELSGSVSAPTSTSDYIATAAGNIGAPVAEGSFNTPATTWSTMFLIGEPGDLELISHIENARPITGFGRLRVIQASTNFERIDVYLVDPGTDIEDVNPNVSQLGTTAATDYVLLSPGDYEMTITEAGEKTVAAGPLALELTDGGVVETVVIDTVDPSRLEVLAY